MPRQGPTSARRGQRRNGYGYIIHGLFSLSTIYSHILLTIVNYLGLGKIKPAEAGRAIASK
jgi:hypothetical protein